MKLNNAKSPHLLSVRDTADRFGVHCDTVNRWIKHNGLPAIRLPGCYRIEAGAFEAWLETQQTRVRK